MKKSFFNSYLITSGKQIFVLGGYKMDDLINSSGDSSSSPVVVFDQLSPGDEDISSSRLLEKGSQPEGSGLGIDNKIEKDFPSSFEPNCHGPDQESPSLAAQTSSRGEGPGSNPSGVSQNSGSSGGPVKSQDVCIAGGDGGEPPDGGRNLYENSFHYAHSQPSTAPAEAPAEDSMGRPFRVPVEYRQWRYPRNDGQELRRTSNESSVQGLIGQPEPTPPRPVGRNKHFGFFLSLTLGIIAALCGIRRN